MIEKNKFWYTHPIPEASVLGLYLFFIYIGLLLFFTPVGWVIYIYIYIYIYITDGIMPICKTFADDTLLFIKIIDTKKS